MKFTILPVLLAMVLAIANMPTDVYQICAWNHGTEKTEPWRSKLSESSPVQRLFALGTRLREWCSELTSVPLLASEIGAIGNIKQLIQDETEKKAALDKAELAVTKAKKAGRDLMAAEETSPEQTAKVKAAFKDLTALEDTRDGIKSELVDIQANLEIARAFQAEEKKQGTIDVGKNNAEAKPATLGEVMQAMAYQHFRSNGRSDKAAFILPDGISAHVLAAIGGTDALMAAASGASSGTPESGGLLVRNDWNTSLLTRVQEEGKLAPRCFPMPVGDGFDGVEAPFVDETSRATGSRWGGVQVYRAAEAAAMTSAVPKLGKFELRLEDMVGLFYATDRVLRDATLLEGLAMKAFTSEFAFKLDDEIIRGTGNGQCLGIVGNAPTVSVAKETNQSAATIVYPNIVKMYARLLARCIPGAEWFINQAVWPQLFNLSLSVGTGGVPAFLPPNGLSSSPFGTLMGLPINVIEQAAALGTVGDIILANFKNDYAMASKPMTSASSIHVLFTSNQTTFRWVWPVIGKPTLSAAITPFKGSDTLGPFVTLATRA